MSAISDRDLADYFDYLRLPSISSSPDHARDIAGCATWLSRWLTTVGLVSSTYETAGSPIVIARSPEDPSRTTVLLYGHYDVQPVEPLELWKSDPFEPEVRDGFVYARGATDNKGQTFSHLIGLRRLMETGDPPVNLIVLLEGEEEIGSPHFPAFLADHRADLACDVALVSDTSMIEAGWPALTLGLRGIACFDIEVHGPRADLHSGMFGGVAPNPALALSRILSRMIDGAGRIVIPGIYDDVLEPAPAEFESWRLLPWNAEWFAKATGVEPIAGESDRTVLERVWSRPTAEINGFTSGHQGEGSKTIIPSRASAKLSFRLVPNQNPDRVAKLVENWFAAEFERERLRGTTRCGPKGQPFLTAADDPYLLAARSALEETFRRRPALVREGLSIPATAALQESLRIPVVLAGLGLPNCAAHSPNESYPIAHLGLGARTFGSLMNRFAEVRRSHASSTSRDGRSRC